MDSRYLCRTAMLDFDDPSIQDIIEERGWKSLPESERVRSIYDFVRD